MRTCKCGAHLSRSNPTSKCGPCRLASIDDNLAEFQLDEFFERGWASQQDAWRRRLAGIFRDLVSGERSGSCGEVGIERSPDALVEVAA